MTSTRARRRDVPPGPRGHLLFGNGSDLIRDPLDLYLRVQRTYGDVVRIRVMPPYFWYLVLHPRDLEHVLVHNQKNYFKGDFFRRALLPLLGNGLFTNEGDSWLAQRRLMQPTFHRGHVTALGTYVTHRLPEFWEEPERFDPERFTAERSAGRPRFAYLPFGGGARQCVGASFALLEARLVLATLAQRFRPRLVPGYPIATDATFPLRPKRGLRMTIEDR